MAKETMQIPHHHRAKAARQVVSGASLAVLSVPGGTQNTKVEVSPQGALPVLSVPGGTETDSELADKHREDANVEVSQEGALPVISVPGGSRL